ncbi:uncharacterized protein LOC134192513 [Corticium candelabrum]|uniref:uncharacterized protein LOC134192513 n=1 Tax=Corticium candelabrum TaxID=121492 RepID=UPI002E27153F|nr:uncharacterized protein LOC134192513 [Corticium candelabrum]
MKTILHLVIVSLISLLSMPDTVEALRFRRNERRTNEFDNCLNKSPLECSNYKCHYLNPRTLHAKTERCYYDKLQKSCLCPREEAAVPCQVHGRDTCKQSECPYAKKTGRSRPNCVWDEHKLRCKSPEPSFFYMLTEQDGELYLIDPDDQTMKYIRNIDGGVSIASSIHTVNGIYAVITSRKSQSLLHFPNVYETKGNGTHFRRSRLQNIFAMGEGRRGETDLFAAKKQQSEIYKFSPGKRINKPLGSGQHKFAGDLATNPHTDKIYGLSNQGVFEVNPANGSHSDILVSLPKGTQYALAFTCDGRLWASGSNKKIYEVDVLTRRSKFLMTLGVHTPLDFASQPGC